MSLCILNFDVPAVEILGKLGVLLGTRGFGKEFLVRSQVHLSGEFLAF